MTHTSCTTSPAAVLSGSTDMHSIACLHTLNHDKLLQYPVTHWTGIGCACALDCQVLLRCCFHMSILALSSVSSTRSFSERGALHTQMCTVRQVSPRQHWLRQAVPWTRCLHRHSQMHSAASQCTLICPEQTFQSHLRTDPSGHVHAAQVSNGRLEHITVATSASTENKQTSWHKPLHLIRACCIIKITTDSTLQRQPEFGARTRMYLVVGSLGSDSSMRRTLGRSITAPEGSFTGSCMTV